MSTKALVEMDTSAFEPGTSRMQSGHDTTALVASGGDKGDDVDDDGGASGSNVCIVMVAMLHNTM